MILIYFLYIECYLYYVLITKHIILTFVILGEHKAYPFCLSVVLHNSNVFYLMYSNGNQSLDNNSFGVLDISTQIFLL